MIYHYYVHSVIKDQGREPSEFDFILTTLHNIALASTNRASAEFATKKKKKMVSRNRTRCPLKNPGFIHSRPRRSLIFLTSQGIHRSSSISARPGGFCKQAWCRSYQAYSGWLICSLIKHQAHLHHTTGRGFSAPRDRCSSS